MAGVVIAHKGGAEGFLFLRIDRCTAPYPFKRLFVSGGREVDNPSVPGEGDENDVLSSEESAAAMGAVESSANRTARSEWYRDGPRFPDLLRKRIVYVSNDVVAVAKDGGGAATSDGEFGLGEGLGNGIGSPLEIAMELGITRIAFVDGRLISVEQPGEHWDRVCNDLSTDSSPIIAILMAAEKPHWAIDVGERDFFSWPAATVLDESPPFRQSVVAWLHAVGEDDSLWHGFVADEQTDDQPDITRLSTENMTLRIRAEFEQVEHRAAAFRQSRPA